MNLLERMFQAIDSNRWAALPEFFAEQAVYERPGYAPIEGMERILRFYTSERIIREGRHHIEGCVLTREQGSCWGYFDGISRDGRILHERFSDVYAIGDDKIVHRRTHFFRPAI
jgi:ketosteroid isomerase-like protein